MPRSATPPQFAKHVKQRATCAVVAMNPHDRVLPSTPRTTNYRRPLDRPKLRLPARQGRLRLDSRQQVRGSHVETSRQLHDDVERGVPNAALEAADVRPIELDVVSKLFLGSPTTLLAQLPQPTTEGTAVLGNSHILKRIDTLTIGPRTMSHIWCASGPLQRIVLNSPARLERSGREPDSMALAPEPRRTRQPRFESACASTDLEIMTWCGRRRRPPLLRP